MAEKTPPPSAVTATFARSFAANATPRDLLFLKVVSNQESLQFDVLQRGDRLVIGRDETADLTIAAPDVSREHLECIHGDDGTLRIRDLHSTNGTHVNGHPLEAGESYIVDADDEIFVAGHSLRPAWICQEELRSYVALAKRAQAATVDHLTGALTRGALDEHLASLSPASVCSVLFIDVDHFKSINDTYGHPVGDKVLSTLGALLGRTIRGNDIVARYGGEEFVIVAHRCDEAGATLLGERIRQACLSTHWDRVGVDREVTVSVGVAARQEGEDVAPWLERADRALYVAKRSGRNKVMAAGTEGSDETLMRE